MRSDESLQMIEHLYCQQDHGSNKNQNGKARNDQSSPSLTPVSPPWPARTFGKEIFAMTRVLEDVRRIKRTSSRRRSRDPFLALTLLFGLCEPGSFFDFALQFFHLPAQLLLLLGELVFLR
jgi:hypothetical protein